jgi:hypothetical protein
MTGIYSRRLCVDVVDNTSALVLRFYDVPVLVLSISSLQPCHLGYQEYM